jgi:glutathione S-transferase
MKIYGHPMSTCTRKVLATLVETSAPYELVTIDFATAEHKQPPHLARQPFGKIPAIDDGGFELYESRAICRYINDKHGGSLVPKTTQARARMEQWMSVEQSYVSSPMMKFIFAEVFKRPAEAAALTTAQGELDLALDVLDAHLAKHPYCAGEEFSLADICYLPYFEYAMMTTLKGSITKRAHVATWWTRISERPSWRKVAGR